MASSDVNLDLSQVDSSDYDRSADKINAYYLSDSSVKSQLSWHWERNQLMLDGRQWIMFDGDVATGGIWRRLRVSKANEFIPRPVTNYLFSNYQTLKSYLIKDKPRSAVTPNTQDFKDKQAAKIATLCLEINWERLKEQYHYETAAANILTYGTVLKKSYWDTSSANLVKVPRMEQIPQTDPQTGAVLGMQEVIAIDPQTEQPIFDELPLGDVNTCIVEPLRFALDPLAMHLHEAKWVMEYHIETIDWVKDVYGKEAPGYTGLAKEVEEDKDLNASMRRWYQLRTSAGIKVNGSSSEGSTSSSIMVENSVVVKDYYEAPTAKYPKGRLFVVAGSKCVYSDVSPYEGNDKGDWHPYSECRWEIVPGRFWGKSPLDDAVEIQKQINAIDSVLILTRKTMAIPQVLIPMQCGVEPGSITGRPGQHIYYRTDGTGAAPSKWAPTGVDASVWQERAQKVEDLKEIMGSTDVLQGSPPTSVNAASAISMLYELATGRLAPILDRWKKFVEEDQKKQLKWICKFYNEPRPEFIRSLMAKNKDLDENSLNNFIGADLIDNCNVVVEAGSNIPKLLAAKQAQLIQMAQMNALNLQNPTNLAKFHQDLGITGYDQDVAPDTTRASWENDLMDNIVNLPQSMPVVLAVDNHELHIITHSTRMKSPQFMALPRQVQQAYEQHIQQHEQFQAMAAQQQMIQQSAMTPLADKLKGAQAMAPQQPQQAQQQHAGVAPKLAGKANGHGPGLPANLKGAIMGADIVTPSTIAAQGR